jgi:hypothetical protein
LSEIRFGVVIPQGWSYDLPKATEIVDNQQQQHKQGHIKNQLSAIEWKFSKTFQKQLMIIVLGLTLSILMIIFCPIMHQISKMICLNVLHYYHHLQQ